MIDIDRRIKRMSAELEAAKEKLKMCGPGPMADSGTDAAVAAQQRVEAAKIRLDLLCDLRNEAGIGRMPEMKEDFERSFIVVVQERLEDGAHAWEAIVRLPGGKLLAMSLSDDMPGSAGEALESVGRMLTHELAEERLAELWKIDARSDDLVRLRAVLNGGVVRGEIPASLVGLFDDLLR